MKCRFCNSDIESDALFCPYCGKDLSKSDKCVNCGKTIENDMVFCPHCGTKQPRENPTTQANEDFSTIEVKECICCGESIEADSVFCPFCGKSQSMEKTTNEEQEIIQDIKKPQEDVARIIQDENISVSEPPKNDLADTLEPYESERSSKKWLWILGVILLLCIIGGGWYYFKGEHFGSEAMAPIEEEVDSIAELKDSTDVNLNDYMPTSELDFLEQFYKGEYEDYGFIKKNVTANVLNKLRSDYDYDECEKCLATWVFTSYPAGGDMNLEEGPIIHPTETEGKYKLDFKYSFYNGEEKGYETRSVILSVTQIDGKYYISNYEFEDDSAEDNTSPIGNEAIATITMAGKVSEYAIHMVLDVNGADVDGYYFYDSQGSNNKVTLKGVINDGRLKLEKKDKDGNETGYFEGHFDGTIYQGDNVNYSRDEKLPFTVEKVNNE